MGGFCLWVELHREGSAINGAVPRLVLHTIKYNLIKGQTYRKSSLLKYLEDLRTFVLCFCVWSLSNQKLQINQILVSLLFWFVM